MARERFSAWGPWVVALVLVPVACAYGGSLIFRVYGHDGTIYGGSPGIAVLDFWDHVGVWLLPFAFGATTMLVARKGPLVALLVGIASAALVWGYTIAAFLLYLLLGGDLNWN